MKICGEDKPMDEEFPAGV